MGTFLPDLTGRYGLRLAALAAGALAHSAYGADEARKGK